MYSLVKNLSILVLLLSAVLNLELVNYVPTAAADVVVGQRTGDLILDYGYPLENHTIITADGYILEYFRIPYGKTSPPALDKPIVLIQHGLASASSEWFLQNEDKTLPFMLANEGYDVWLGNSRGTTYSNKHVWLSSSNPTYWNFSYEEMGIFDLPAAIDHILETTSQTKLFYIGHSQGTTQFFAMLALRPEYNSKIRLMSAFAPVAFLSNVQGSMRALYFIGAVSSSGASNTVTALGIGQQQQVLLTAVIQEYAPTTCTSAPELCNSIAFLTGQFDQPQTNQTKIPDIISQLPDTTSVKCYLHYAQGVYSGDFARFNYGLLSNQRRYGQPAPPSFNISAITAPIALYWSEGDVAADPVDVAKLISSLLPNVVRNYSVPYPPFNHIDFAVAINASEFLYKETIRFMNLYLN